MTESLSGMDVLVTGARSGIGLAISRAAHRAGARVWGITRHPADDPALFHRFDTVDVTDDRQLDAYLGDIAQVPFRGLVNSAGAAAPRAFLEATIDELDDSLALNLRAPFLVSQRIARTMAATGGGSIVHIGSVNAARGVRATSTYSAAKGGLSALTRSMAVELAPHGIRVNEVAPAPIDTPRLRRILSDDALAARVARIPLHRLGRVEEVAEAVVFLLSERASFITGQTLAVDGGYLAFGS